jgi:hypothetical protein
MVQDILPLISALNISSSPRPPLGDLNTHPDGNTTSQHYAVVESEHPYKPATVSNQKVSLECYPRISADGDCFEGDIPRDSEVDGR